MLVQQHVPNGTAADDGRGSQRIHRPYPGFESSSFADPYSLVESVGKVPHCTLRRAGGWGM